jgi:hypothetical protein
MTSRNSTQSTPSRVGWKQLWPYALLSLIAFICAALLLAAFFFSADKIVALGLTGKLYYIVLLPLGLCVSAFLFGVLRAYGAYTGHVYGGRLELGGAAVGFFLVVVLGFTLPEPSQNFSLTILVHGSKGNTDMALRSSGSVVLDTGELRRTASIGPNGDALFPEIPANLRGRTAAVGLDSDNFELSDPRTTLQLTPATFYVEVHPKSGRLAGYVYDPDHVPLSGVTLSAGNLRATTNDQGYFEMQIAGDDAHREITLAAAKSDYVGWNGIEQANSNDLIITLQKNAK